MDIFLLINNRSSWSVDSCVVIYFTLNFLIAELSLLGKSSPSICVITAVSRAEESGLSSAPTAECAADALITVWSGCFHNTQAHWPTHTFVPSTATGSGGRYIEYGNMGLYCEKLLIKLTTI